MTQVSITHGSSFYNEVAGGEVYNTLSYLANSSYDPGVLYAGSDDGLIHVRMEEGGDWTNISPLMEGESLVNSIEVSHMSGKGLCRIDPL